MSELVIENQSIHELVKSGYGEYQQYVNDGKFIPSIDGLKYVQRRYLLSVKDIATASKKKSADILGNAMSKWHPHELQVDALYSLVRYGLVNGQGNFGSTVLYKNIDGAAQRYTEIWYNKKLDSLLFKFQDYFLMQDGEGEYKEPKFLITPVPIALIRGTEGIGVGGVRTKIPAFTYASLLDAYQNDDPSLLKSAYGLEIDYEKSTLKSLWEVGHGKVVLKFKYQKIDDGVYEMSGDATVQKPDISKLLQWEKDGLITISDRSTDKMVLRFSRNKNIRKIDNSDILNEVKKACTLDGKRCISVIMFSHEGKVVKMGIKGWLGLTLSIYNSTFAKWQELEVKKYEKSIERLKLIPAVADLLNKGESTLSIAKTLDISKGVVQSIEGLPLRMLRKADHSNSIKKLEAKIKTIKDTKVLELIESGKIVDTLLGQMR
jgi:DNA gyrase/topoisomerase IV subunit A